MPKTIKQEICVNPSIKRKFFYVLNGREQREVMNELMYMTSVYSGIDSKILLEASVNKAIKRKIHGVVFEDISKDVKEHKIKVLESIYGTRT